MGLYIFYTNEGYTIAPNTEELESSQVLGIENGGNKKEALYNLYKNNDWIKENCFSEEEIRCYALLKPEILDNIKILLDYLWENEKKNWEKCGCPKDHIFQIMQQIKKAI